MEHRFTDTPDGTLAGSWWTNDAALSPACTWAYSFEEKLLLVTRGRVRRPHQLPFGPAIESDEERRRVLPALALQVAREIKKPK